MAGDRTMKDRVVLLTLVWDEQTGTVGIQLPDDPEASARLSGPTALNMGLLPDQLGGIVRALGREAGSHLRSLIRQHATDAARESERASNALANAERTRNGALNYLEAIKL